MKIKLHKGDFTGRTVLARLITYLDMPACLFRIDGQRFIVPEDRAKK
tara:strand:+ start:2282 stop:2422 length:141 start_codon:yes stop_codon:yes gene_type:complete